MAELPNLARYLDRLPDGIDSYPKFLQKASIVKPVLELAGLSESPEGIPKEVAALIENPPPPSVWISEVHGTGLWLVVLDHCFSGDAGRFFEFSMNVNKRIVGQSFYKTIMRMVGPTMGARGVAAAWSSFHRGIEQSYERTGKTEAEIRLTYPSELLAEATAPSYVTAFAAALEVGGTKVRAAKLARYSKTEAAFDLAW